MQNTTTYKEKDLVNGRAVSRNYFLPAWVYKQEVVGITFSPFNTGQVGENTCMGPLQRHQRVYHVNSRQGNCNLQRRVVIYNKQGFRSSFTPKRSWTCTCKLVLYIHMHTHTVHSHWHHQILLTLCFTQYITERNHAHFPSTISQFPSLDRCCMVEWSW